MISTAVPTESATTFSICEKLSMLCRRRERKALEKGASNLRTNRRRCLGRVTSISNLWQKHPGVASKKTEIDLSIGKHNMKELAKQNHFTKVGFESQRSNILLSKRRAIHAAVPASIY